jgi:hypothetical protein
LEGPKAPFLQPMRAPIMLEELRAAIVGGFVAKLLLSAART